MAIPANASFATATAVSSFPFTDTQDVFAGGIAYEVFYKITVEADGVLGIWAKGETDAPGALTTVLDDHDVYVPGFTVWNEDQVTVWMDADAAFAARGKPFYVPVTAGQVLYFHAWPWWDEELSAEVTVSILKFENQLARRGDFITGREVDTELELPLTVLNGSASHTTCARKYVQIAAPTDARGFDGLPHGDQGAILSSGTFVLLDNDGTKGYKFFDRDFSVINSTSTNAYAVAANNALQRYYVASAGGTLTEYDRRGVITGTSWTGITGLRHVAVNLDSSIAYGASSTGVAAIRRWDLVNDIALTNLAAAVTNGQLIDLVYLEDDTLLALYHDTTGASPEVYARRYDTSSGLILNTYSFGDGWRDEFRPPRIGRAVDSPDSFWITLSPQPVGGGTTFSPANWDGFQVSTFRNVRMADGFQIGSDVNHANYLFGAYIGPLTDAPECRWGAEKTFPLLVMPLDEQPIIVPEIPSIPCCDDGGCGCDEDGPGGSPSTAPIPSSTGPVIPPVIPPPTPMGPTYWEALCAGGGDVPSAADATDAESWIS